jgi:large subunit ribosomal protein L19
MKLIEKIEGEQIKKHVPFNVGDSVKVHTRVKEGEKERTQIFAGVIIAHKGRGLNESFTVRRISYGEGVERIFPLNSPRIEKIEVEREGQVRRAKLFYLRGRKGKEALFVKERVKATLLKKEKSAAKKAAKAEKAAAAG